MPGLETFALSVVIGRGARYETQDQSGWCHLLEHMVFKGAGSRSSRDIVELLGYDGRAELIHRDDMALGSF